MNLFSFFEDISSIDSTSNESSTVQGSPYFSYRNGYKRSPGTRMILRSTATNRQGQRQRLYEIEKGVYCSNPRFKLSPLRKALWRIVIFIMALFFFAAAYVQHNDPDPYLWMPVYIVPLCVNVNLIISLPMGSWSCLNKLITCHLAYCYTLGFWTLAYFLHSSISGDDGTPHSNQEPGMFAEEAKELLGLCLVISWLSFVTNGNFLRFGGKGVMMAVGLTALPIVTWAFLEELEGGIHENCNLN